MGERLADRSRAAEVDRCVLELERVKATKGRFDPETGAVRAGLGVPGGCEPAIQQLAQMGAEIGREFIQICVGMIGGQKPTLLGEVPRPELFERGQLPERFLAPGCIPGVDRSRLRAAIDEHGWTAVLVHGPQRVLEFPLRAGHGNAAVDSLIAPDRRLRRHQRAEPRPQDQHHDVEVARRLEGVLEVAGGQQHLGLLHVWEELEMPPIVLADALDGLGGRLARVANVARGRNEDPDSLWHDVNREGWCSRACGTGRARAGLQANLVHRRPQQ